MEHRLCRRDHYRHIDGELEAVLTDIEVPRDGSEDSWDVMSSCGGYVQLSCRPRAGSVYPSIPTAVASQQGWGVHELCFSMWFRGRSAEQLCFSWRKAADDPNYESSLGHDPSPWEGYSWFFDSRFVDDDVPLDQRAPWVTMGATSMTDCLLWRTSTLRASLETIVGDPEAPEGSGDESVEGDEENSSRWIVVQHGQRDHVLDTLREVLAAGDPYFAFRGYIGGLSQIIVRMPAMSPRGIRLAQHAGQDPCVGPPRRGGH